MIVGTWSQIASEEVIDMVGGAGFDFTIVDCEHGAFDIETAARLFRACDANGVAPLARASGIDAGFVARALDAGATAVVVPGIASGADAQAMVRATRFAPHGTRGACPCVRAGGQFITDWRGHVAAQAAEVGVVALVETAQGLAEIDAITATEGLLALLLGPFDLSVSLGLAGDHRHPEVERALDRMIDAAGRADLPVIAPIFDPDPAEVAHQRTRWADRGVSRFTVGTDKIVLADGLRRYARAAR